MIKPKVTRVYNLDLNLIFSLLIAFQVKHFVADYPLQYDYMMQKIDMTWRFLIPLGVHCAIHALLTLAICLYFAPHLWWLSILDFVIHFIMDRIKSGPKYLGRFDDPVKHSFWICLGLDQMIHHLTHYFIVWYIYTNIHFL